MMITQQKGFLFAQIIYLLMSLFSFSSIVLYACMGRIASEGFYAIGSQLRSHEVSLLSNPKEAEKRIKKWKHNHEMVCAYVYQLNRSFGPILFVRICCIFVAFVIQSFYLFVVIYSGLPLTFLLTPLVALVINSITLIVTSSVSDNIRAQVYTVLQNM